MKMSKMIFAAVCIIGMTQIGLGQVWSSSKGSQGHGIPGYLDSKTHKFTTKAPVDAESEAPPAALVQYYGSIVITYTIYIGSTFPAETVIGCHATASTSDSGGGGYGEEVSALAPAVTNGRTTCTLTIFYDWGLSNPASDPIYVSVSAEASNVVAVNGQNEVIALRVTSHDPAGPSIASVPTHNGTITSLAFVNTL